MFVLHMDLLVFIARINNFDVERIYLDTKANVNIIFIDLLEKIKLRKSSISYIEAYLWSGKR